MKDLQDLFNWGKTTSTGLSSAAVSHPWACLLRVESTVQQAFLPVSSLPHFPWWSLWFDTHFLLLSVLQKVMSWQEVLGEWPKSVPFFGDATNYKASVYTLLFTDDLSTMHISFHLLMAMMIYPMITKYNDTLRSFDSIWPGRVYVLLGFLWLGQRGDFVIQAR